MPKKPKDPALKALHYKTAVKEYADVYAPIVARSAVFIRSRETTWRMVAQKVAGVPRVPLRQLFMTFWAVMRRGYITDANSLKMLLYNKYPHYPEEWINAFVEAVYGEGGGGLI